MAGKLRVSNGRILITEGTDEKFNTDDLMFHEISTLNGTTQSLTYSAGNGVGLEINDRIALGNVHPVCTQVIGAVKFTLNNYAAGMAFDRWHMVMGGSICWVLDGEPGFLDRLGSNLGTRQVCFYSFSTTGGVVYLERRVVIADIPFEYFIRSHTITYKLRCGAWS